MQPGMAMPGPTRLAILPQPVREVKRMWKVDVQVNSICPTLYALVWDMQPNCLAVNGLTGWIEQPSQRHCGVMV